MGNVSEKDQWYNTGVLLQEKNPTEAFKAFQKAADMGCTDAQYNLGVMYSTGNGVLRDDTKAVEWYTKAADEGDDYSSQYNLGVHYMYGRGVEQDKCKAVALFRKSADHNYHKAQFALGLAYDRGDGVEQDRDEALSLLWRAADCGSDEAKISLQKSANRGALQKAADNGHCKAQFALGKCYDYGFGVKQDKDKALELYKLAAEQDHDEAKALVSKRMKRKEIVDDADPIIIKKHKENAE